MSLGFTAFHVAWSTAWAALHVRVRRGRRYVRGRDPVGGVDNWYRRFSSVLFFAQLALSVSCFWSDTPWLLELYNDVGFGSSAPRC